MKKIIVVGMLAFGLIFGINSMAFADATATADANATAGNAAVLEGGVNITFPESRELTTTNVNAKGYRGFPNGIQMTYPGIPTYLNGPTPGASVTDLEDWLMYGNVFDLDTLDNLTGRTTVPGTLRIGYKTVTVTQVPKVDESEKPEKMKILLKSQVNGVYKRVATITVKATNLDVTTEKLIAAAALEAAAYGASEIHVLDAGMHRVMKGSGWGIGVYYYAANLNSAETSGGMGGGGTGFSTGESGYQDKPWVKVVAVIPAQ